MRNLLYVRTVENAQKLQNLPYTGVINVIFRCMTKYAHYVESKHIGFVLISAQCFRKKDFF